MFTLSSDVRGLTTLYSIYCTVYVYAMKNNCKLHFKLVLLFDVSTVKILYQQRGIEADTICPGPAATVPSTAAGLI